MVMGGLGPATERLCVTHSWHPEQPGRVAQCSPGSEKKWGMAIALPAPLRCGWPPCPPRRARLGGAQLLRVGAGLALPTPAMASRVR
eukprot:3355963-Alexandrium_andersonii.AAC.1